MMREYIVTVFGEDFRILAPEYGFNRARYLGYKAYLKDHPKTNHKISELMHSGKAKVHVVKDMRVKE